MKKITFSSNYGNFEYKMSAEIGDEVNAATEQLCLQGLANIGYRIAGSNVDKGLGVKVRKEVAYSEDAGEQINGFVADALKKLEEKPGSLLKALALDFAVTGEYVPQGSGPSESKEARDMWGEIAKLKTAAPDRYAAALQKLGLEDDSDETANVSAVHSKLKAAKAAAKLAAMGGLGL